MAEGEISVRKELLWSNPNPYSAFVPQTISMDLSAYSEIEIYAIFSDSMVEGGNTFRAPVGMPINIGFVRSDLYYVQSRIVSSSLSGLTFSNTTIGQEKTIFNNHCIPVKIYGIK